MYKNKIGVIMWRIVKSEIEYFKWLYILSILFVIVVNSGLTIDERWIEAQSDFPGLRVGIVVLFFCIIVQSKKWPVKNKNSSANIFKTN